MRIAILQGAFLPVPPTLGGAVEKMWFRLGQEFASRGHEVFHISRRYPSLPDREVINDVQHIRVNGFDNPKSMLRLKVYDGLYTWRAGRLLPAAVDLIVTNTFWAPIVLPVFTDARVYVDVARMPKGQIRFYGRAARLRANSTPVAEAIRAELPKKEHGRVIMIPNPIPFVTPPIDEITKKDKIILYCGRVHPEKGLHLLGETIQQLPSGWSVRIVGPWEIAQGGGGLDYKRKLEQFFAHAPVEFIGPVFDSDVLNELYRSAAIFVYPSVAEKGETFGLAPLEAMAWGCVPVVSGLACFRDFIVPEKNGMIFDHRSESAETDLAFTICRLIEDNQLTSRLSSSALGVREIYAASRIADLFLEDFQKVLQ